MTVTTLRRHHPVIFTGSPPRRFFFTSSIFSSCFFLSSSSSTPSSASVVGFVVSGFSRQTQIARFASLIPRPAPPQPLESPSSKGAQLITALAASSLPLRQIVATRRPRNTLNNIPPPPGFVSRVFIRCAI